MNTSVFNCHWSKRAFVVALLALTVTSCATGEYEGGLSGEGEYHGQGSLVLTSGESYVGYFVNGLALDGGFDGISEIRKVIKKSSELIKYGGKLILEIAYNQTREVKKLLKKNGFYTNLVVKDLAKNDRCIISTKIEE